MASTRVTRRLASRLALLACAGGLTLGAATAPAGIGIAVAPKITASGVGAVKVGATYQSLRAAHLIGRLRMGCELAGPRARAARLAAPVKGGVTFTLHSPRKVANISVTGGAKARGVGVGATIAQIKAAFPKAVVDHSTDGTFALTLVRIPKGGGGRLEFGVETSTHKASVIGVPAIAFCD